MLKEMTKEEALKWAQETMPWLKVVGLHRYDYDWFFCKANKNVIFLASMIGVRIVGDETTTGEIWYCGKILADAEDIGKVVKTNLEFLEKLVHIRRSVSDKYVSIDKDDFICTNHKVYKYETIGGDTDKFYYGETK